MENSPPVARKVTIGICTSSLRSNIEALIAKVSGLTNVTVRFIELPYNDLDSFRLPSAGLDGVIICHSINNRRFAITDVMDALYHKFLPHVKQYFGQGNICVLAHDFPWPIGPAGSALNDHVRIKDKYMDNFRSNQPTTFEFCKLAMICGRLDKQVDVDEEDWSQLEVFVHQCQVQPESARDSQKARRNRMFGFFMMQMIMVFLAAMFLLVLLTVRVYRAFGVIGLVLCLIPLIGKLYHSYSRDQSAELIRNYGFLFIVGAVICLLYFVIREVYYMLLE